MRTVRASNGRDYAGIRGTGESWPSTETEGRQAACLWPGSAIPPGHVGGTGPCDLANRYGDRASVASPCGLVRSQGIRPFLAIADDRNSRQVHAKRRKIVFRSIRPALAQRQIIFQIAACMDLRCGFVGSFRLASERRGTPPLSRRPPRRSGVPASFPSPPGQSSPRCCSECRRPDCQ